MGPDVTDWDTLLRLNWCADQAREEHIRNCVSVMEDKVLKSFAFGQKFQILLFS